MNNILKTKKVCCKNWRKISILTSVIAFIIIMIAYLPSYRNAPSKLLLLEGSVFTGYIVYLFVWVILGLLFFGADVYKK